MTNPPAATTRDDLGHLDHDWDYDLVVVGGGAAGLSAAKIAARPRRSVLVVDAGQPRNAPAAGVHNYLYAEGGAPADLRATGRAEVANYGVAIHDGAALAARVLDDPRPRAARFAVTLAGPASSRGERAVRARRLLLATGLVDGLPDLPGLAQGWGRDVLHCPFCHGWEVRDRAIGVIATGPTAVHQAGLFRALSEDVVVFWHDAPGPSNGERERLAAAGIGLDETRVDALERVDGELTGVRLADGRVVARQAVSVTPFLHARADLLDDLGLGLSDLVVGGTVVGSYVATGAAGATAVPGVWAADNLADPMAQVITAAHVDLLAEDAELALARFRERRLTTAEGFWESHHRGRPPARGGPNPALVDVVSAMPPASVLDLGCGDGGDAIWLAGRGWQVTAVDISRPRSTGWPDGHTRPQCPAGSAPSGTTSPRPAPRAASSWSRPSTCRARSPCPAPTSCAGPPRRSAPADCSWSSTTPRSHPGHGPTLTPSFPPRPRPATSSGWTPTAGPSSGSRPPGARPSAPTGSGPR